MKWCERQGPYLCSAGNGARPGARTLGTYSSINYHFGKRFWDREALLGAPVGTGHPRNVPLSHLSILLLRVLSASTSISEEVR
jgi:hypothetical protein